MKKIFILIIFMISLSYSAGFEKLSSNFLDNQDAKQDSSIWVENPVADVRMGPSETKSIDITDVFATNPDTLVITFDFPVSGNNLIVTANLSQNESTGHIFLDLVSKTVFGSTYVIIKAETDSGNASDTLNVKVDDPSLGILQWGINYSFSPENCIGSGSSEWKAAVDFDLGTDVFELREIEFGYGLNGTAEWKITRFNGTPGDSMILNIDSSYCKADFKGGEARYIELPVDTTLLVAGHIAVVFSTTSNFMSMDPGGDSDHTWIYSESAGWEKPEEYSPDYAGAWYIKLFVKKTGAGATGIEEIISSVRSPVLLKNYPNPFNSSTVISWDMPVNGKAELSVYNQKGQLVKCLNNCSLKKGVHSVVFEADGLDSGIYFYQLKINGKIENSANMLYLR